MLCITGASSGAVVIHTTPGDVEGDNAILGGF